MSSSILYNPYFDSPIFPNSLQIIWIPLVADGPQLKGSSHLSLFNRHASSAALLQIVNLWLNFTHHVLTLSVTEIELTTSALIIIADVRGYLLDHSGDVGNVT